MTSATTSIGTTGTIPGEAVEAAGKHVGDILRHAIEYDGRHEAVVVYDTRCDLAAVLASAYRHCLPKAKFIDFDAVAPQQVLDVFAALAPSDLVVLIQSTAFRLDAYRLRVELFKRGLKVVEHVHLARLPGAQAGHYIEALAYDPAYLRGTGWALKQAIDGAQQARLDSGGEQLIFASPLETAKLNIGDYSGMNNVGGQFPIGEVFTEARDLEAVHGAVRVFAFGDTAFAVNRPEHPIVLTVSRGRVVEVRDSTPAFDQVLDKIRADEGEIWLRELGFGLNRAFTRDRMVSDVGTYERMCGVHLSLGAKHGVYSKPAIKRKDARYHIDIFPVTEAVYLDQQCVYRNGAWQV
ncbi:MAG: hypothetical protein JO269_09255 [Burkholderiaceae bacterium]|nr:hypothetical protein [Burkholderiaceae bacterium]